MIAPIQAKEVCATVLAGGRATRMGGIDKGLQTFKGHALVWHALQRLQQQSLGTPGLMAINANRNLPLYGAWGSPVWPDANGDYDGPLAGFLTALQHMRQQASTCPYLLVVPCDSPLFPLDLLERLATALRNASADVAVAAIRERNRHGVESVRAQPVFCLLRATLETSLRDYMVAGGKKIADWTARHPVVEVSFDGPGDNPHDFFNANTLAQLHQLEQT